MPHKPLRVSTTNYFVSTTANNSIKVWQLESVAHTKNEIGKLLIELFEPNYLQLHYTCMDVLDVDADKRQCLIVLGDAMGRIVVFDAVKGCKTLEISHRTKDVSTQFQHVKAGHNARVNCVKFDRTVSDGTDGDACVHIVSCAHDKKLCRWDLRGSLLDTIVVGEVKPSCFAATLPFSPSEHKTKRSKKHGKYVMVAGDHIDVWNTSVKEQPRNIGSFQGQASKIRHLLLTQDNQYLISAAHGRHVYVWRCKPFYKKKPSTVASDGDNTNNKLRAAEHTLSMDEDIVSIAVKSVTKALSEDEIAYLKQLQATHKSKKSKKADEAFTLSTKDVHYICAATKSSVYIWCFDPVKLRQCSDRARGSESVEESKVGEEQANDLMRPAVQISVAAEQSASKSNKGKKRKRPSQSASTELNTALSHIQHVHFVSDTQLMVVRGNESFAVLKQVAFINADADGDAAVDNGDAFISRIVLENVSAAFDATNVHNLDLSGNVTEQEKHRVVDRHLTVLHVSDTAIANPTSFEQCEPATKKRKRSDSDGDDCKQQQQPQPTPVESESMTFQDKLYAIEKRTEEQRNSMQPNIPNADSLYTLLTQSLNANDQSMFDALLSMQNDDAMRAFEGDLIKNTLDRIPGEMAVQLLERLTEQFRASPRDCLSILRWLLPLLNTHSASFAKNTASRKHLISIYQAIDYQVKSLLPAMKLRGRLSLLMKQMEKVSEFNTHSEESTATGKGLRMARNKALFVHDEHRMENQN